MRLVEATAILVAAFARFNAAGAGPKVAVSVPLRGAITISGGFPAGPLEMTAT